MNKILCQRATRLYAKFAWKWLFGSTEGKALQKTPLYYSITVFSSYLSLDRTNRIPLSMDTLCQGTVALAETGTKRKGNDRWDQKSFSSVELENIHKIHLPVFLKQRPRSIDKDTNFNCSYINFNIGRLNSACLLESFSGCYFTFF